MFRSLLVLVVAIACAIPASAARPGQANRPTVVIEPARGGFRWQDAAIGAGAAVGVVLIAAGVVVVARSHQAEKESIR